MKKGRSYWVIALFIVAVQISYASNGALIKISPEGRQAVGIQTETLQPRSLSISISAPGEVIPNKDLSAIITPRIPAQVMKRLVKVGDYVKQDQPLVQLSSVAMAEAQSKLMGAYKEWLRAKKIQQKLIPAKYYHVADMTYQRRYSRLLSYGMTAKQIKDFLKSNDPNKADGVFTLLAPRKGTVLSANFALGQIIRPGKVLYKIVDETDLWVDAKLSNNDSTKIRRDDTAIVQTEHDQFPAKVMQVHHQMDTNVRMRIVRLNVSNPNDLLHPGQFVTCVIHTAKTDPVLAVRQTTLMRTANGHKVIYTEVKPNVFQAKEVKVIQKIGPWRVIKGIEAGARIVTKGAFFVHSEQMKNGLNTHNH